MPDFVNHIYPSKTAVLVINMSNGFVSPGALNYVDSGHRFAPELGRFLDRCRRQKIAVIYAVQAYRPDGADLPRNIRRCSWSRNGTACIDGTWECEIYEPCAPSESDIIIKKQHYDAFHQTDLAVVLQASQIDTIAIAGVCTDVSCLYTARGAFYLSLIHIFSRWTLWRPGAFFWPELWMTGGRVKLPFVPCSVNLG